ncbi:hypothetical protein ERICI_00455 [Paenibacillus larvae subsp. larvae]|uniref:Uncharacterized protein n=1 Tax=Paenibacillus larvae subsp. larvae TaxID=147375 RepID=A0A2L1UIV4_9BACL|nr:hypothetical protein [Paenibacillus larvae]ETK28661.1 hypothetical protein ERIC1_1c21300 [Paenibacillus larvae subsp. larvae DSM 25719]AVF20391.1 hypothetical protein ERICI_00455 [Paenibacillus larvae subsp. larvae]AVF28366.1 hypothetical protein ERICIII_04303 [Paenibacillus larvae subsp. larvae]AVF32869.1 hypothetical protein ERICIV_04046 [Paenibacillus larvae subsp. larvae]AVG10995.1 hypothetical protein ERICII_00555 [Paenibacillus larvae subsp. larvae DSM 25430]
MLKRSKPVWYEQLRQEAFEMDGFTDTHIRNIEERIARITDKKQASGETNKQFGAMLLGAAMVLVLGLLLFIFWKTSPKPVQDMAAGQAAKEPGMYVKEMSEAGSTPQNQLKEKLHLGLTEPQLKEAIEQAGFTLVSETESGGVTTYRIQTDDNSELKNEIRGSLKEEAQNAAEIDIEVHFRDGVAASIRMSYQNTGGERVTTEITG